MTSSSAERLAVTVKQNRKENKDLEIENEMLRAQVEYLRREIDRNSVSLNDSEITNDFVQIMESTPNMTSFMKLFWEEQKKVFRQVR